MPFFANNVFSRKLRERGEEKKKKMQQSDRDAHTHMTLQTPHYRK